MSDSAAAKSIHRVASRFYKGRFYEHIGHRSPKTLFSSTDPQFHAYRRRLLGGAMSETSIRQHEPTVAQKVKLCVDQMAREAERRGCIDVFKWWCFLATDTIGELSFGESFRMLEKGEVSLSKTHRPLVAIADTDCIEKSVFAGSRACFHLDDHPDDLPVPISGR